VHKKDYSKHVCKGHILSFPLFSAVLCEPTKMKIAGRETGRNRSVLLSKRNERWWLMLHRDVATRLMKTQDVHHRSHRSFCLPVTCDIKTWRKPTRSSDSFANVLRISEILGCFEKWFTPNSMCEHANVSANIFKS